MHSTEENVQFDLDVHMEDGSVKPVTFTICYHFQSTLAEAKIYVGVNRAFEMAERSKNMDRADELSTGDVYDMLGLDKIIHSFGQPITSKRLIGLSKHQSNLSLAEFEHIIMNEAENHESAAKNIRSIKEALEALFK